MRLQFLVLASSLLLAPLIDVASAYPRPTVPNLAVVSSGNRPGTGPGRQGGRPKDPKDGPKVPETILDLTGSDETSSGEPESDIFHSPDGDADSACQNRLPEALLFSVEKGHDCVRMANIYNDQNTSAGFNCKTAAQQKEALCREAPHFGALAENCYDFLTQNYPMKADAIEPIKDYVGLCRQ